MRVREYPPTRLSVNVTSPGGKVHRWGQDERRAENVFDSLSFSTVAPGGCEQFDATLPRKVPLEYADLTRLSNIAVKNAGGGIVWEGRLEKAPRESGDEKLVSPQAVGWQAHLDDSKGSEVYVDRDLGEWKEMSAPRRLALLASYNVVEGSSVEPDAATSIPAIQLKVTPGAGTNAAAEADYDAGPGNTIDSIYYDMTSKNTTGATMTVDIGVTSTDAHAVEDHSADLLTSDDGTASDTFSPTANYRYGYIWFSTSTSHGAVDDDHLVSFRRLTVWGNHGLSKQGTAPADGLYASDVIANAVGRWAPYLRFTTGANGTIKPSAFIIPQLAFKTPVPVSAIITEANRFMLWDWMVWPGQNDGEPTFHYHERGAVGRKWRARVGPSQLAETGPQVERLYNGVIVTYQDVDGTTKSVGPTDAPVDTESTSLVDDDPLNPVNQLGIQRWATLEMGIVSTSDAATEVGRRFLEETKALDQSGTAELHGWVEDEHGVMYPSHAVRAGDTITFTDAADPSPRRIVRTQYEHEGRVNSIDLDAPPEGMDAVLEQLGAVLLAPGIQEPVLA